jgi:hypothetical protein
MLLDNCQQCGRNSARATTAQHDLVAAAPCTTLPVDKTQSTALDNEVAKSLEGLVALA